jgi:hypothetical protein
MNNKIIIKKLAVRAEQILPGSEWGGGVVGGGEVWWKK